MSTTFTQFYQDRPQPTDTVSGSLFYITSNFKAIDECLSNDHYEPSGTDNELIGKHKQVTFPNPKDTPPTPQEVNGLSLYTVLKQIVDKQGVSKTIPFLQTCNGQGDIFTLAMGDKEESVGESSLLDNGYMRFENGLLLNWGKVSLFGTNPSTSYIKTFTFLKPYKRRPFFYNMATIYNTFAQSNSSTDSDATGTFAKPFYCTRLTYKDITFMNPYKSGENTYNKEVIFLTLGI